MDLLITVIVFVIVGAGIGGAIGLFTPDRRPSAK
jgi:hypothetical protein